MKYVRLLNAIRAIAFISAAVVAFVGASRPHHGRGIRGWPAHAFVLCWGILALTIIFGIIFDGKIKTAGRGSINPQKDPVKFRIFVGIISAAGIVALVVGASKLLTDISRAS
jgi:hypothetical protein